MKTAEQLPMQFSRRGGARKGAGRPKGRRGVTHEKRPELSGREALHVTIPVLGHVWNLRTRRCFAVLSAAFLAAAGRFGMRVVALGIQGNHLHLLVEAASTLALSLGMQGLTIRLAKGLNRLMGRHGRVFRERFHCRVLRTPAEVRAVFAYIGGNTARHARQAGRSLPAGYRDPFTIGHLGSRVLRPDGSAGMVVEPDTWLLKHGWQRTAAPDRPRRRARHHRSSGATALLPLRGGAATGRAPARCAAESPTSGLEHRDRAPLPVSPRAVAA